MRKRLIINPDPLRVVRYRFGEGPPPPALPSGLRAEVEAAARHRAGDAAVCPHCPEEIR